MRKKTTKDAFNWYFSTFPQGHRKERQPSSLKSQLTLKKQKLHFPGFDFSLSSTSLNTLFGLGGRQGQGGKAALSTQFTCTPHFTPALTGHLQDCKHYTQWPGNLLLCILYGQPPKRMSMRHRNSCPAHTTFAPWPPPHSCSDEVELSCCQQGAEDWQLLMIEIVGWLHNKIHLWSTQNNPLCLSCPFLLSKRNSFPLRNRNNYFKQKILILFEFHSTLLLDFFFNFQFWS